MLIAGLQMAAINSSLYFYGMDRLFQFLRPLDKYHQ